MSFYGSSNKSPPTIKSVPRELILERVQSSRAGTANKIQQMKTRSSPTSAAAAAAASMHKSHRLDRLRRDSTARIDERRVPTPFTHRTQPPTRSAPSPSASSRSQASVSNASPSSSAGSKRQSVEPKLPPPERERKVGGGAATRTRLGAVETEQQQQQHQASRKQSMPVSGSSHLMTATRQTRVSQPKASTSSSSNNDGRVTRSSAAAAAATTTTPAARSAPDDEDEESDADVVIVKRRTSGRQPRMNAAYHAAVSTNKRPSSSSSRAEASLSKTSNDTSTTNTGDRSSARSSFVLSPMTTQTTSTPNDAKRVESREPREIQDDDGHMDVDEQEQTTPSKKRAREPSLQQEKSDVVTPTKPNKGKQRAEDAEVSSSHLASPPDSHQRGQRKRARHDSGPLQAATNVFVCDRDSEEEQVDESEDVYEEAEDEESTAMPTPVRTPSKKSAGPTATTATTTSTPPSTERRRSNRQAGFGPSPLKKTLPDVLEDARDRTPEPAGLADDDDDDYWTELQQHQEEDVEDHSRAAKRLLFSRDQLDELVDRVARNLHMTGRDDPSISPAAAWEQSVRYTLDGAVSRGVGNCMLLVGPRGSGKSRAVDGALSSLAAEHGKNAFITVRLSGLAQTTDRLAMREIARQLCAADRRVDEHEGDFGSHASTMATLLRLLEPPSDSTLPNVTEEGSDAQRSAPLTMRDVPVLFVLDEFDLFALHPRQSFLYCLLDIVQGNRRRAGMAVLGLTSRVDVLSTSVLEKRVRSRCSSNVLNFAHERSFESFELLARSMLVLREPAAEADHAWNAEVDAFLADRPVREYLERLYNIDGMTPAPLKSTLVEMLSHVEHKLMMADGPARIPRLSVNDLRPLAASMTRSTVLRSLSMLEVYVLIAAKHARSLSSADDDRKRTFNLEILYDRYSKHVARRRRTEPTLRKVPKQAFAIALDKLRELEVIVPGGSATTKLSSTLVPSISQPFRAWRLVPWDSTIDDLVYTNTQGVPPHIKKWCKSWSE